MPKLKTSSSVVKRFKLTHNDNILRHQTRRSHLLQKKSSKHKNRLSRAMMVKKQDIRTIKIKLLN
uniref:50S ribosomal protein L35 n=1 Tax=Hildenbrandia rivularis TaxID=135206 RepID=A0A1C9CF97_9FLOR|nr:ribosomal protein L35 [Hildenbrandia rivularis]AOM67080.1 ribosomal protein L35 [Hildenbrandia rivularis]